MIDFIYLFIISFTLQVALQEVWALSFLLMGGEMTPVSTSRVSDWRADVRLDS